MTQILVIDPESAGADLVIELRKRDVSVITWWQDIPFVLPATAGADARPEESLIRFAEANTFDRIIAGSEGGVTAAEWLATHLKLPTSDPAFMHHRRDKNAMMHQVARSGIPAAQSFLITDRAQIDDIATRLTLPVMVKPSNSAGSDLCRAAETWEQARTFAAEVIDSTSIMRNKNDGAVVQEFIEGPQYHVNTVVVDGVHEVTEVYSNLFRIIDGAPQLYAGRTYGMSEPGIAAVVTYTLECLQALGATEGAAHTEVRLTEHGPRLIEFNGRLMGPGQPYEYFRAAQGFSQASIYADVLAGNSAAARSALVSHPDRQALGFYMLTGATSGVLTSFDVEPLAKLDSYRTILGPPEVGSRITIENRTTDGDLGLVLFAHRDVSALERDLRTSERLERDGQLHTIVESELTTTSAA